MAVAIKSKGDEELEMWLNRATDPTNREINWDAVNRFSQQVSNELEGPQIALRLLAHKIQSPQENEALYALAVTESCVRNCGPVFHQELGKFRFLNELIKVLSPKYLGSSASESVKKRCTECLYGWSKGIYTEPKIKEAYEMLKKQSIITRDPVYIDQALRANPYVPLKRDKTTAIFSDEKTAQEISRLLKSKRPEDLMAANRLIKSVVRQDTERLDRLSKRLEELETVRNNAQLLSDMLGQYRPEEATQSDIEIIRELYKTLGDARPRLYRLAGETETTDEESMKEVLAVNDQAAEILKRCAAVVGESQLRESASAATAAPASPVTPGPPVSASTSESSGLLIGDTAFDPFDPLGYRLPASAATTHGDKGGRSAGILDLADLPPVYSTAPSATAAAAATPAKATAAVAASNSSGDIDLLSDLFGSSATSVAVGPPLRQVGIAPMMPIKGGGAGGGGKLTGPSSASSAASATVPNLTLNASKQLSTGAAAARALDTTFQGLDQLGKDFLTRQSPKKGAAAPAAPAPALTTATAATADSPLLFSELASNGKAEEVATQKVNLSALSAVSVASLRPHVSYAPQPVIQSEPAPGQGHVTVMLHFAEPACSPAPGVAALLCVVTSTLGRPCRDVALTVTCRKQPDCVLAQAPSGTGLAASSPMLPSVPLTQCLLVRDPADKSLAFQLTYCLAGDGSQQPVQQKSLPVVLPDDLL